jgi:hypothetical protein
MRPFSVLALAMVFTVFCATLFAQTRLAAPAYRIIVHPNNPAPAVERTFLQDAFLKKTTSWPGGEVIRPVDLAANSPVRRRFSDDILRRSVEAVKGYWQQRIFSGRDVPPPELEADEEVVKYVLRHDGAVGCVSGGAALGGSKALAVQ